jgi:S-DNA-T family DNA segregation ATPase FtsK/SpoIIIE
LRERLGAAVGTATLLVVDDAERTHDRDGLFAEILRGDHPHVTIVAGARLESVRSAYGHWTREVARSRCGIVMTAPGEIDGELLGAVLPRRSVVGHRPGLGWVIDGGGLRLVQVAGRMPE